MNTIQSMAFKIPFVRVDKREYLTKKLSPICDSDKIEEAINSKPANVVGLDKVDKLAKKCVFKHALITSAISCVAAIPANFYIEMLGIVIDVIQFQLFIFIVAQKLMFLYGHDISKSKDEYGGNATATLWAVSAIMIGAHRVSQTMKTITGSAARKVVLQSAARMGNRIVVVNVLRQVCKWFGLEVTKNTLIATVDIIVSLLCSLISGMVTFWLFYPMCKRLIKSLRKENE